MSSPERPSSREQGFTLIEIIVVVGILMVIISVFAVGMARTIASSRAVFKMNMLAAYFADARALASATASIHGSGSSLQFEYDPAKNVTTVTVFKYRPSTGQAALTMPQAEKGLSPLVFDGRVSLNYPGLASSVSYSVLFSASGPVAFFNGRATAGSNLSGKIFTKCATSTATFSNVTPNQAIAHSLVLDCSSGDLIMSE